MRARSTVRNEPPGGRTARPRRRDDRLLVFAAEGLAHPCAAAQVPGGEVDIVARRGRTLAFVEVKARPSNDAATLALDAYRLRRVAVAAERLVPRFMREGDDMRIDAIVVVPGRLPRHITDIWLG